MKLLLLALFAASTAAYSKNAMLESNRVPVTSEGTTCEECQSVVKRFTLALHDPVKMAELKTLLNVLCHETSYVEECRLFVSKLDIIITRLEPYLRDEHAVCKKIHLCENSKLTAFHKIGLLYLKKADGISRNEQQSELICDECKLAAAEIKTLVEDKEKQAEIRTFLSEKVCRNVGSMRGMCDMVVEQFLPELFQELDEILKDTKQACADIGFCGARVERRPLMQTPKKNAINPVEAYWAKAGSLSTKHGQVLMSCLDCKLEWDGILDELINKRQDISNDLRATVCDGLLPANFSVSCNDFMGIYLPTVVYMTVLQFTPTGICTHMHTCSASSSKALAFMPSEELKASRCEACDKTQQLIKDSFVGSPSHFYLEQQVREQLCDNAPKVLQNFCDRSVARVGERFAKKFQSLATQGLLCQKVGC